MNNKVYYVNDFSYLNFPTTLLSNQENVIENFWPFSSGKGDKGDQGAPGVKGK
jgi:hypothetical protein